jgi:HPt (histidine-containing phosphotransfer) domain-containing protein
MGVFLQQSDENMRTLRDAHARNDADAWNSAAHMFKGGAGGVGARALQMLCDQAQHFDGAEVERQDLLARIEEEYGRVKAFLERSKSGE